MKDDFDQRPPFRQLPDSGGGSSCPAQNAVINITIIGSPSGGNFTAIWSVNNIVAVLTLGWNFSAAQVATALATHPQINSTDNVKVFGQFPTGTVSVEFVGALANTNVPIPTFTWGGGSGLTPTLGVAVIGSLAQKGSAG